MAHDWILDVLADLKAYADKNGLSALADELDETTLIAATEIASIEAKGPVAAARDARTSGFIY